MLNLLLVPSDPGRAPDDEAIEAAWSGLVAAGVVQRSGRPGPQAALLGGFTMMRIDRPPTPAVYGNRQGGFRVACPRCDMPLAGPFSSAARRWKAGGERRLTCPGCGAEEDLSALHFAPPAALGRFALELRDVPAPDLTPSEPVDALLRAALGGDYRVVGSRGR